MKLTYFFYNTVYILAFIVGVMNTTTMFGERDDEAMVYLPQKDAALVEKALEYVLNRAPRQDAPQLGDPEFPVFDLDLSDIRRILCTITSQLRKVCGKLEDIQVDLSAHDMLLEDCCAVIEDIKVDFSVHDTKVCGKLEDIKVDFSAHDMLLEDCCSVIEEIDDKIGEKCDKHYGIPDGKYANDYKYTVIQWLKLIYCMCASTAT